MLPGYIIGRQITFFEADLLINYQNREGQKFLRKHDLSIVFISAGQRDNIHYQRSVVKVKPSHYFGLIISLVAPTILCFLTLAPNIRIGNEDQNVLFLFILILLEYFVSPFFLALFLWAWKDRAKPYFAHLISSAMIAFVLAAGILFLVPGADFNYSLSYKLAVWIVPYASFFTVAFVALKVLKSKKRRISSPEIKVP